MKMKWMAAAALGAAALALALVPSADAGSVVGSKHDFSTSGNQTFKGTSDQTCIYCHTPHNAGTATPLWNHTNTTATFTLYASPTLNGTITQPAGVSKMCLSCHDGTIAIDAIAGGTGTGTNKLTSGHAAYLGTDISNDHPISITYEDSTDTGLRADDGTGKSVTYSGKTLPLYSNKVECASCHNPHDNAVAKFLRYSNSASALCLVCHNK